MFHPAEGYFLTHQGWKSTCESISATVPMVYSLGLVDWTVCRWCANIDKTLTVVVPDDVNSRGSPDISKNHHSASIMCGDLLLHH